MSAVGMILGSQLYEASSEEVHLFLFIFQYLKKVIIITILKNVYLYPLMLVEPFLNYKNINCGS